jgi:hypothetical protein
MALVVFDRVKETSNTSGTGTIVLAGAVTGYQSFALVGNANTTYYTIADQTGANWEVGIGTYYSGNVSLARTTILSSSNANAVVNFTNATHDVFITYPANKAVYEDETGNVAGYPITGGTINGTVIGGSNAVNGTFQVLGATKSFNVNGGTNGVQITPGNTGVTPTINSFGGDANVSLNLNTTGTGTVNISAANITGGTISNVSLSNVTYGGLGTMSTQNANSVTITGGTMNNTAIGGTNAAAGTFTTITGQTEVLRGTGQNLLVRSQEFNDVAWTRSNTTVTANTTVAPDGTTTADTITASAGSSQHDAGLQGLTVSNGISYTISVFAKAGTNNFIQLLVNGDGFPYANFDLSTGVVGTSSTGTASISSAANGFYRCVFTYTTTGTTGYPIIDIVPSSSSARRPTWTAAGTETVILWGAQFEIGSTANTYVPTTTTAIYGTPTLSFSGVANVTLDSSGNMNLSSAGSGAVNIITSGGLQAQLANNIYSSSAPVNYIKMTGGPTGYAPLIIGQGSDASVGLAFITKSGGIYQFYTGSGANQQFGIAHTASAVNYIQTTGSATGANVTLSAQGSDTNIGVNLAAKGSGSVYLQSGSNTAMKVDGFNAVNYWNPSGSIASNGLRMDAGGSDTDISMFFVTKGAGSHVFTSGGSSGTTQFRINPTASANNYVQVTGAAGGVPIVSAQGADTNISLRLASKGTSPILFSTNYAGTGTGNGQFAISHTANSVNFIQATGGATGSAATLSSQGSDTDVSLNLTPKGAGNVAVTTGYLGVGTSIPAYPLDVVAASNAALTARIYNANTNSATQSILQINAGGKYTSLTTNYNGNYFGNFGFGGIVNYYQDYNTQTFRNNAGATQFYINGTASAVNYIQVAGAVTTAVPSIIAAGSDANVALSIRGQGTGYLNLMNNQANYFQVYSAAAGSSPTMYAWGSDTNVNYNIASKGTGYIALRTNDGSNVQALIAHTANAVNYVQLTGATTGSLPGFYAQGSDASVSLGYRTKNSGSHVFYSDSGAAVQFSVSKTASSVNYLQVTGAATGGEPTISAQGSDTDVDINLTPKGTGYANITSGGIKFPDATVQTTAAASPYAGNSSIILNNVNITSNATIAAGQNGFSVGPITTANGVSVTVASGQQWVVI